jgi:hypothetical protein
MIKLKSPSFCFNSCDVGPPFFHLWKNLDGPEGITPSRVAAEIWSANAAALNVLGSSLKNIVINCHGYPGGLRTGGGSKHGFYKSELGVLGILKPFNVGTIWLVSCDVAAEDIGRDFCLRMAQVTGALVIASDSGQQATFWQGVEISLTPSGLITDYDGTVYSFSPEGIVRKGIDPIKDVETVDHSPESYYFGKVNYWH